MCGYGIPDATECPVRELSLMRETTDERRTMEPDRHAPRNVILQDVTLICLPLFPPKVKVRTLCRDGIPDATRPLP